LHARTTDKEILMHWRFPLLAVVVVGGCKKEPAMPVAPAPPPIAETPTPVEPDRLARGAYVATISGCVVCHTPMNAGAVDKERPFAGGREEQLYRGGTWRSPNITPDRETGIGAWSDAQIIAAIRTGVRHDGERLLPIMPYPYFHRMTDEDATAVVAYLRAQRPIVNKVARSEGLQMSPIELPAATGNVDRMDDPEAHGEYLANLMHCEACHTPQDGPNARVAGAGGTPFRLADGRTISSANITSDPDTGIGSWSEDQIIATLRTMETPDGTSIQGPMASYKDVWSQLTDGDARALAAYVESLPAVRHEIPDRRPAVTSAP
jgi:mono/diheme cytochrome c family protein